MKDTYREQGQEIDVQRIDNIRRRLYRRRVVCIIIECCCLKEKKDEILFSLLRWIDPWDDTQSNAREMVRDRTTAFKLFGVKTSPIERIDKVIV